MTGPITDRLAGWAEQDPDRPAVIVAGRRRGAYRVTTYRELDDRSSAAAAGLREAGFTDGRRVALMVPPGRGTFEAAFALMKAGACPVLVDPGIGMRVIGGCLERARVDGFVGTSKAFAARAAFRWAPGASLKASVGRWPGVPTLAGLAASGARPAAAALAGPAAVVFTSGSTGPPKGVTFTHSVFHAQVDLIGALYGIDPGTVNVATFLPFALLGPLLGMTTVLPYMDFTKPGSVDPTRILEVVRAHRATMMFGSPALLDRVGRYGEAEGARLPGLRTVLSAGAPVRPGVWTRMLAMLDEGAEIATPYGATEALPVCSITTTELAAIDEVGICVGRPVEGVGVTLIPVSDDPVSSVEDAGPVEPGEIGEIVVQGANVTPGYLYQPEANRAARLMWHGRPAHRMGDLGRFDGSGLLWFCGRKSHRVPSPRADLATVPVEEVFTTHPAVARSALVGARRDGAVRPVVCVELEPGQRDSQALRAGILRWGIGHPAAARTGANQVAAVLVHPGFPTDIRHNSKIDRPHLARWAGRKLRRP